mmetsp:Transcript_6603/g.9645  ORF Transcript_6603/g.9645 Transcript_6603/m.9645 type:complete len:90 (+) Transcript_6603:32-301(+)
MKFDKGGFNTNGRKFEVHPQNRSSMCLTNPHHPRPREVLKFQNCSTARKCKRKNDDCTNFWNAITPPKWDGHPGPTKFNRKLSTPSAST